MAILLTYGTARVLLAGDAAVREEEYRRAVRTRGLKQSSGFRSTNNPELHFRALLAEGDTQLLFYREASDRLNEVVV
jgi:hypothetical protein